jgi:hypothetical protein
MSHSTIYPFNYLKGVQGAFASCCKEGPFK